MKKVYLLFLFSTIATMLVAQEGNMVLPTTTKQYFLSYQQLKEYEGLYEYINNSTLKVAASPKDTTLYAIINEIKYKLVAIEKDVFVDMTKNKVRFFRDKQNTIAGYYVGKDTLKLLDNKLVFPKEIWYPRYTEGAGNQYTYQPPKHLKDGLETASVNSKELNHNLLRNMMDKIMSEQYANVHSILIAKNNKLVFEEYFYEHNQQKLHELRSATKSFFSALTGIAIDKGYIKSKNEKVLSYFPEYTIINDTPIKHNITIENLLTNQSGLDCDISNPNSLGNEVVMGNTDDWVKFTLDLPMIDTPRGKGMYCSGNPITIGRIIEKTTKTALPSFANDHLFKPLGIKNFNWRFVPNRTSSETFCQLYLTSRDMMKFGLLYLNKGNWNGKQIVSASWVEQSFQNHAIVQGVNYGYLWWNKYFDANGTRYYAHGAQGNGGQKIYLFPDLDMVIVITGGNYNTQSPSDELIRKFILPAFLTPDK